MLATLSVIQCLLHLLALSPNLELMERKVKEIVIEWNNLVKIGCFFSVKQGSDKKMKENMVVVFFFKKMIQ